MTTAVVISVKRRIQIAPSEGSATDGRWELFRKSRVGVDFGKNGRVHRVISAETTVDSAKLFAAMADLSTYTEWMSLIDSCEPAAPAEGDSGPAWLITLRAKVGPFSRSKRLRMVQVVFTPNTEVRFERFEIDGKQHSEWVMEAIIAPLVSDGPSVMGRSVTGSSVTVELTYSGGLWSGPLDVVLGSQVDVARDRLCTYLEK